MLAALAAGGGEPRARLARAFEAARDALAAAVRERPDARGCRTTAVALLLEDGVAHWGHVGDSRLYHFRDGSVTQRTLDHSVPQALVDAGELAPDAVRGHPDRNRLLRSLGADEPAQPTLAHAPLAVAPGDAFLLCSDGFWELVAEDEMGRALAASSDPADWLRRMETRLRAAARGAYDNYTAIAVRLGPCAGDARARRGLRARAAAWAARLRRRLHSAPSPADP
jgi:serine/threonine protein phosphatase PrpC